MWCPSPWKIFIWYRWYFWTWVFSTVLCLCIASMWNAASRCCLHLVAAEKAEEKDVEILICCISRLKTGIFSGSAEVFIQKTCQWPRLHSIQESQGSFWRMARGSCLERLSPLPLGGSGSSALISTVMENGDFSLCLFQCQCSGRGPREYKFVCLFRPCGWSHGATDMLQQRALVSSGQRLGFHTAPFDP